MNKLTSFLPIALVVLCGCDSTFEDTTSIENTTYKSYYEADKACEKWEAEGMKYTTMEESAYSKTGLTEWHQNIRRCWKEEETKQILGMENIAITQESYEYKKDPPAEYEVKEYFKY